jgi:tetratricopeptide (TPR) repeat protein
LLFIAHPAHTEVVANIKSRDEILAFLFSVLSLKYLFHYVDSNTKRNLFFSLLFFFLSLLSKETAISMIIIFPLSLYFFRDLPKAKLVFTSLLHFAVALTFLAIRYYVLELQDSYKVSPLENSLLMTTNLAERTASAILILGKYLLVLFVPTELLYDHSYNQIPNTNFGDYRVWLATIAYLSLTAFAFRLLRSKNILSYAILLYLTTLALFSNLVLTIGVAMAERFLYFASLGYCIAITWAVFKLSGSNQLYVAQKNWKQLWENNKKVLIITGLALAFYSSKTIQRNLDWKNNLSLYKADLAKSENNARTHAFYANELLKSISAKNEPKINATNELMEVVSHLKQSLSIYPTFPDALENLADAYFLLDSLDKSEQYCRQALAIEPNTLSKLGEVLFKKKDFNGAIAFYQSAIKFHPKYSAYYFGLGLCYGAIKDYKAAASNFESALNLGNRTKEIYFLLENCYKLMGDSALAEKYHNLNAISQ